MKQGSWKTLWYDTVRVVMTYSVTSYWNI